jgi:hypothetical protein
MALATIDDRLRGADNELTPAEKEEGWILLFDGKSMKDWMTSEWQRCDQALDDGSIEPNRCNTYMMTYERPWSDFILALDFKIAPQTNSGIFVRTSPLNALPGFDVGYNGIEVQILDSRTAGFYDTGALYDLVKPTKNAMKPVGEWNHIRITCNKNVIDVELNGAQVQYRLQVSRPDGLHRPAEARGSLLVQEPLKLKPLG